ncbi:hypothetical protein [Rhizobium lusitanum]|uniref:hypothetical protein n=1 Tax=Rhizobium lusitanum TaxID=293958 RepID=UPI001959FCCB|nr:hypothetical protein [Rhizobium lusitanum]MBM7043585.1 hypothetical protein [Rhizobium lusitanum]
MRAAILGIGFALVAMPALAKPESLWIEKVAILAVGQGVCGMQLNDETMQITIGSAMIQYAISKDAVISRARKRAHQIVADIQKNRTQKHILPSVRVLSG